MKSEEHQFTEKNIDERTHIYRVKFIKDGSINFIYEDYLYKIRPLTEHTLHKESKYFKPCISIIDKLLKQKETHYFANIGEIAERWNSSSTRKLLSFTKIKNKLETGKYVTMSDFNEDIANFLDIIMHKYDADDFEEHLRDKAEILCKLYVKELRNLRLSFPLNKSKREQELDIEKYFNTKVILETLHDYDIRMEKNKQKELQRSIIEQKEKEKSENMVYKQLTHAEHNLTLPMFKYIVKKHAELQLKIDNWKWKKEGKKWMWTIFMKSRCWDIGSTVYYELTGTTIGHKTIEEIKEFRFEFHELDFQLQREIFDRMVDICNDFEKKAKHKYKRQYKEATKNPCIELNSFLLKKMSEQEIDNLFK